MCIEYFVVGTVCEGGRGDIRLVGRRGEPQPPILGYHWQQCIRNPVYLNSKLYSFPQCFSIVVLILVVALTTPYASNVWWYKESLDASQYDLICIKECSVGGVGENLHPARVEFFQSMTPSYANAIFLWEGNQKRSLNGPAKQSIRWLQCTAFHR